MKNLSFFLLLIATTAKAQTKQNSFTVKAVSYAEYNTTGPAMIMQEYSEHLISLKDSTIQMTEGCGCQHPKPEKFTDIIEFEKNGMYRLTFWKGAYKFFIYGKKVGDIITPKKMLVYQDGEIRFDYQIESKSIK